MKTFSVFDLNDTLPVLLEVTDDITSVRLGVLGTEGEVVGFPKGTRISLDGGNSYYMTYTDYAPEFNLQKNTAEEENPSEEDLAAEEENLPEQETTEAETNPTVEEPAAEETNPIVEEPAAEETNPIVEEPTAGEMNPTGEESTAEETDSTVEEPEEGEGNPMEENPVGEEDSQKQDQNVQQVYGLLDFSHTGLKNGQKLLLAMETYIGQIPIDLALAESTVGAASISTRSLPVTGTPAVSVAELQAEQSMQKYSKPILNQDCYLELTAPEAWKELDVDLESETDCILEILTMTDEGSLEYREVSITEETFLVTYTNEEQEEKLEHKLELKLGEKLPQAGTYRLNLNWKYEGVLFKQTQTTFFINYSEHLNRDLSSPEVQTND